MAETSIEWTDHSINPFRARDLEGHVGHYCEKISAGCTHCYASKMQKRFLMPEYRAEKRGEIEVFFDESKLQEVLHRKKPTKYFWCDMTDMFLDCYPFEWLDKCFAVMALTPHHTHQILTKRPARMREYLTGRWHCRLIRWLESFSGETACLETSNYSLPNVWLGVSVEDQKTADERIPLLLQTPAAVRWVSYEPALGPVDFSALPSASGIGRYLDSLSNGGVDPGAEIASKLDWIVCGGESGPGARPFKVQWARDVIAQCKAAGVPCFVKQLGSVPMEPEEAWRGRATTRLLSVANRLRVPDGFVPLKYHDRKGGDPAEWPADLRVREYPNASQRVGG